MKVTDALSRVMPLAKAIQSHWKSELPKRHPRYPLVDPTATDGPPPPETARLRELLEGLPVETLYKLVVVDHVGRAALAPKNAHREFRDLLEYDKPRPNIETLMRGYSLADELDYGLEQLRSEGIDLDLLEPVPAGA